MCTNIPNMVTMVAPVNIAVIKYWGKRDESLILPLNDSVSGTLSVDDMCAKTTVHAAPHLKQCRIWLNGKEESFDNQRLRNCLQEIRRRAAEIDRNSPILSWNVHICSENNFPTAAGLASSAAGYACLVVALAKLFNLNGDISSLARLGSGSACRSVYGGFVRWHAGAEGDGSDSIASQIVDSEHWPEMRVLILVVNDQQKKVSSTRGMVTSVRTSELLKHRVEKCVPFRTKKIIEAIKSRNFNDFAEITMKDSNQFHATCLDTYPPCFYMNDVSRSIINLVHLYNDLNGDTKVAYTFDAGPNACLYLLESEVPKFLSVVDYVFPFKQSVGKLKGLPVDHVALPDCIKKNVQDLRQESGLLKYIIHTKIGSGPKQIYGDHLLNETGLPKATRDNL